MLVSFQTSFNSQKGTQNTFKMSAFLHQLIGW